MSIGKPTLTFILPGVSGSQVGLKAFRSNVITMRCRSVETVVIAREQAEGVSARVRRSIGCPDLPNLDPFLLLDEFRVRKPAGFPEYVCFTFFTFIHSLIFAYH